ncbi:unnamed protein product [Bursaphelenchus xylophilus]|uniref:(pine wood nematode) hypothetical protein n=1 Tax=Bursaphelenchus xylophilus TaxID=6326 RepID=A0A1I7RI53_BURXY|nr:unnamed protein product [Bursaphelenchus xylophilus]CAG9115149.1 unnamed protein product [Bursaphelenchus xylophilus]
MPEKKRKVIVASRVHTQGEKETKIVTTRTQSTGPTKQSKPKASTPAGTPKATKNANNRKTVTQTLPSPKNAAKPSPNPKTTSSMPSPTPKTAAATTPIKRIPAKASPAQTARPAEPPPSVVNEPAEPLAAAPVTAEPVAAATPTVRPALPTLKPAAKPMVSEATVEPEKTTTTAYTDLQKPKSPAKAEKVPARNYEATKTMGGGLDYSILVKPQKPMFYKDQAWLTLFIVNTSKFRLCFRIIPPNSKNFTVTPLSGFVEIGKSTYVAIQRLKMAVEYEDRLEIEFGPDTGVQQAAVLFDDAYCDSDKMEVLITCTNQPEPVKKSSKPT